MAPEGVNVENRAFDVTPAGLVTGLVMGRRPRPPVTACRPSGAPTAYPGNDVTEMEDGPVGRAGWVWIAALCGYSLLRAVLAWPLLVHYDINPATFLVLDVGTAYPLGLAQVRIVQGFVTRDFAALQVWGAVAGISFITPYAYLLITGHQALPVYVMAGLVAVMALIATASVLRLRQACLEADGLEVVEFLEPASVEL